MKQTVLSLRHMQAMACLILMLAPGSFGQTQTAAQHVPSSPTRPFVVMPAQSLSDLERKLQTENKAEDLIGGGGMENPAAVPHGQNPPTAAGEVHDGSHDGYPGFVSTATLHAWRPSHGAHEIRTIAQR